MLNSIELQKIASDVVEEKKKVTYSKDIGQLFFEEIQHCQDCNLCKLEVNWKKFKTVGAGKLDADVLLVGIAPSWFRMHENTKYGGTPFGLFAENVGELKSNIIGTTRQFYQLIEMIGLENFYVTNLMKCSTFEDKEPDYDQREICKQWLRREIEELRPKLVLCFGSIFQKRLEISYGEFTKIDNITYGLLYHPGYIMRSGKKHLYEKAAEKIKELSKKRKIIL